MAKSLSFRSFNDGKSDIQFSSILFRAKLNEWKERKRREDGRKRTNEDVYEVIADMAHVSTDAVKNWYKGSNGPSDLQTVKSIASALEINYEELVVAAATEPERVEQDFTPAGTNEKDLIVQIYKLFIDYIYLFIGNRSYTYASTILENPNMEKRKYIWNLYHYLDQIALSIEDDTYKKLRRTISELEYMDSGAGPYIFMLPPLWYQINPYLEHFSFDVGGFNDDDEQVFFESVEDNEEYEILHMYEEDLPFLVDGYKEFCRKNNRPVPENYIVEALTIDRSASFQPPYQLYTREVANTLTALMKHMFPQYFKNEENIQKAI